LCATSSASFPGSSLNIAEVTMAPDRPLRVAILHPDLGLGGAERLVVDAALELQHRGHHVTIFTGGHDPARAFEETCDGTLDVRVCGGRLPLQAAGRLRVIGAITKMAVGAAAILRDATRPDVVLCDVVPHVVPLFRLIRRELPVVFYCHFPDQLLTPPRRGLYRWYRSPIDALETAGTAKSAAVLVNSRYTASVFARTYPKIGVTPEVVYPGVDMARWIPRQAPPTGRTTIVSVARFERAKNVALAIAAFAALRTSVPSKVWAPLRLVLAGGFDARLTDCVETLDGLRRLARSNGLEDRVDFCPSCPEADLHTLMAEALAVVYTPEHEHFGYVPVEAMACGRPVVAAASGGPCETVVHDETGFLVPPTPEAFGQALARLITDPAIADHMGAAGRARVETTFSRAAFGAHLEATLRRPVDRPNRYHGHS
jgi:alpha-1,3/alpha-1,6-mannosyltransferase